MPDKEMYALQLQQVEEAIKTVRGKKFNAVYMIACGGSKSTFGPAQYIFDSESDLPAYVLTSNEFNYRKPKQFTPQSLVLTCSHSGNTPETVQATQAAKDMGCVTICLSNKIDSELWQAANHGVYYGWGDYNPAYGKSAMLYRMVFGILNELSPNERFVRAIKHIDALETLVPKNKDLFAQRAAAWGKEHKREPIIYTMASGEYYPEAYSFAVCLLMEMQWIHSSSIHSGEYFHGPFEITDYDVPFLMFMSRGKTRYLDQRALNFAQKYSDKVTVIDAQEFNLGDIEEDLQSYFAAIIMTPVARQYADSIADHRGHPLSVRRYMWRMEY
jgi:fructoselysine 6-phosphate deglycase